MKPRIGDIVMLKSTLNEGRVIAIDPVTLLGFTVDHDLVVEFTKGEEKMMVKVTASNCYIKGVNPEDRQDELK